MWAVLWYARACGDPTDLPPGTRLAYSAAGAPPAPPRWGADVYAETTSRRLRATLRCAWALDDWLAPFGRRSGRLPPHVRPPGLEPARRVVLLGAVPVAPECLSGLLAAAAALGAPAWIAALKQSGAVGPAVVALYATAAAAAELAAPRFASAAATDAVVTAQGLAAWAFAAAAVSAAAGGDALSLAAGTAGDGAPGLGGPWPVLLWVAGVVPVVTAFRLARRWVASSAAAAARYAEAARSGGGGGGGAESSSVGGGSDVGLVVDLGEPKALEPGTGESPVAGDATGADAGGAAAGAGEMLLVPFESPDAAAARAGAGAGDGAAEGAGGVESDAAASGAGDSAGEEAAALGVPSDPVASAEAAAAAAAAAAEGVAVDVRAVEDDAGAEGVPAGADAAVGEGAPPLAPDGDRAPALLVVRH